MDIILKSGLSASLSFQKQPRTLPSEVASAGMERPALVNSGSAPTSEGPKSLTITSIWSYFAIAAVSTFWLSGRVPVGDLEGLLADHRVLRGVERLLQSLDLAEALAVALGSAQEEHVAAVGQDLLDPVAPVDAVVDGVETDVLREVHAVLAARVDAVGHGHDTGLEGAAQGREHGLAGVGEDDEGVDALGHHPLDVGDALLGVALPVGVEHLGDAGALGRLVLPGRGGDESPAVAAEAVGEAEGDLLRAAPGGSTLEVGRGGVALVVPAAVRAAAGERHDGDRQPDGGHRGGAA